VGGSLFKVCYAFEAHTSHPLLQAWENAIASMAEADEKSLVRSVIIKTVMSTVKSQLDKQKVFTHSFHYLLLERMHLQYDPVIPIGDEARDGKSKTGAFVLYDKHNETKPSKWRRIDSPMKFREFISDLSETVIKEDPNLEPYSNEIQSFIESDAFMVRCIERYYPGNDQLSDPLNNYKQLKFAPWVTKIGNNITKVIQVYRENSEISPSDILVATDCASLIQAIDEIREQTPLDKRGHPYPIRIPGIHAFTLMLNHPSLKRVKDLDQVQEDMGRGLLPQESKEQLIRFLSERLTKKKASKFSHRAAHLKGDMGIKDYRDHLLELFYSSKKISSDRVVERELDTELVKVLPEELKERFRESAIHFADTNWAENGRDIHFCAVVNPGTGKVELWGGDEEGRRFFALDQNPWVKNKNWEIFLQ